MAGDAGSTTDLHEHLHKLARAHVSHRKAPHALAALQAQERDEAREAIAEATRAQEIAEEAKAGAAVQDPRA